MASFRCKAGNRGKVKSERRSEKKTCSPRTDYQHDLLSDGSLIESCSKQMMMVVAVALTRIMKKMAIFFPLFFDFTRGEEER